MCESVSCGKSFPKKWVLRVNKKEFATLAMALQTYFPREQLLPNTQAMELWYRHLKNIPLPIAEMALQKWVATNKWSPSISEIFNMIEKIHWEAYEITSSISFRTSIPAEELKQYEWIYEVTKPFKMAKLAEPSIRLMLNSDQPLQIGSGGEWHG